MTLPFDPNDPRLTAFALGELDDLDQAEVETLLSESDEARRHVESIQATARLLTAHLQAETAPRLAASQLDAIEGFLPKPAPRTPFRWRALASAAAILIAGGGALALWMAQKTHQDNISTFRNTARPEMPRAQAAAPASPAAPPAAAGSFQDGSIVTAFAHSGRPGEMPRATPSASAAQGSAELAMRSPNANYYRDNAPAGAGVPGPDVTNKMMAMRGGPGPGATNQMMGRGGMGGMGGMGGGMGGMMGGVNASGAAPSRGRRLARSDAGPRDARYGYAGKDLALNERLAGQRPMKPDAQFDATDYAARIPNSSTAPVAAAPAGPSARPGQPMPGLVAAGDQPAPTQVPAEARGKSVMLGLGTVPAGGQETRAPAKPARESAGAALARAEARLESSKLALQQREEESARFQRQAATHSIEQKLGDEQEMLTATARARVAADEAAVKLARADQAGDRRAGAKAKAELADVGRAKAKAKAELAEAQLQEAEATLRFRSSEKKRVQDLLATRSIDQGLAAEQEKLLAAAETRVETDRKAVKAAKDQLALVEAKPETAPLADQERKEAEPEPAQQQQVEQPPPPPDEPNTNDFDRIVDNPFLDSLNNPLSTFSIDVDTASYAIVRHFLSNNQRPPKDAVRIEEMVNYFTYDDPPPTGDDPFSVNIELARCPWNAGHRLARIGLKGKEIAREKRPLSNLVFLVDVSGSMGFPNKLPLVKESLRMLTEQLGESDRVAIVVYAAAQGLVLPPTTGDHKDAIIAALDRLEAGGSTNGGAGIQLAYDLATQHFVKGGTNRVILCTDGDFNVGVTDRGSLIRMVEERAKSGVFLSVMGFGMGNLKDATMEQVADKGNGNYAHIDTIEEGRKVFVEQMTGTLLTIAKDVKIQVDFNPAHVRSYRLVGFENRMLRAEDFRDDAKDAGEIGAGHSVTALYELVPQVAEKPAEPKPVAAADLGSKYVKRVPIGDPDSREWLTVRLRYKAPDGDTAREIERAVTDHGKDYADASVDFKFAAAVAAFGMILRDSPHKGSATLPGVLELAEPGLGPDRSGYRHGFLDLVRKAQTVLPH